MAKTNGEAQSPREKLQDLIRGAAYAHEEIKGDKPPADAVVVDVIGGAFAFKPEKLEAERPQVVDLIREVVSEHYFKECSHGCSIMLLQLGPDGEPWAAPLEIEGLAALAIGLHLAHWTFPKEKWNELPLGAPFISFDNLPTEKRRERKVFQTGHA